MRNLENVTDIHDSADFESLVEACAEYDLPYKPTEFTLRQIAELDRLNLILDFDLQLNKLRTLYKDQLAP